MPEVEKISVYSRGRYIGSSTIGTSRILRGRTVIEYRPLRRFRFPTGKVKIIGIGRIAGIPFQVINTKYVRITHTRDLPVEMILPT